MLDDFLQQLVEEGDLDSHGRITLDASKAREKLANSRFSRSSEALLAVIAAALLGGATQVKVACLRTGWEFHCDAKPPSASELENLMRDLFRKDQPPLLRELGLAFNSLFPKYCQALEVLAGDRRGWFEGGEWKTQPIPVPTPGWELRLQRQASLTDWWRWLLRRWAPASDLQILQARTRWSPSPILFEERGKWRSSYELEPPSLPSGTLATINIQSQITGLGLPNYPDAEPFFCHQRSTRARTSLRCAILPGDPRASQLLLVYRGLILARHHLTGQAVRFHGVINTDSLDLDASRQHVVQNQRLRQRIETARQWVLEGTAAWLRQLDPERVNGDLLAFLQGLLNSLNRSANHQPLLSALEPMPLLVLGDGQSSLTLGELRQSLVRFPALHTGPATHLHDRPLLHPTQNNLKKLSRLLKVPTVDATPWVREARSTEDLSFEPFERFLVRAESWEATVILPSQWGANYLLMRRAGKRFWSEHTPLFQLPVSFVISLDGSYDGALEFAQKSIMDELRQALLAKVEEWLTQLQQQGGLGKVHLEHYAGLLCLWMRGLPGKNRRPPAARLDYASGVHSLAQLVQDQVQLAMLAPENPVRRLAEWL
ncbi:MAG: hypothetical protein KF760_10620 [Candidatus Eremiobacteraeota bacterium]|nr:hypothetical protein [Candidatus Eremiobacteraeota bacterium]MCW5869001.1 hypothetical protein [Candidatus Eremiobacteraeota bacterium]